MSADVTRVDQALSRDRTRRSVLAGLSAALGMTVAGGQVMAQAAQAHWWENLSGFGTGGSDQFNGRQSAEPRERKVEPLNDLRPDNTPWRSDTMLDGLEAAIEMYQKIVSSGGWQAIPGPRMIRPGDDDERVPLVRRRLRATGDLTGPASSYQSNTLDGDLDAFMAAALAARSGATRSEASAQAR